MTTFPSSYERSRPPRLDNTVFVFVIASIILLLANKASGGEPMEVEVPQFQPIDVSTPILVCDTQEQMVELVTAAETSMEAATAVYNKYLALPNVFGEPSCGMVRGGITIGPVRHYAVVDGSPVVVADITRVNSAGRPLQTTNGASPRFVAMLPNVRLVPPKKRLDPAA